MTAELRTHIRLVSSDTSETHHIGRVLGASASGQSVLAVRGQLGAGKTQLAKGVAVGLSVTDPRRVSSPTFTIMHEHAGRLTMYHIDAYRLTGAGELESIGFEEICTAGGVVVVEWADKVESALPADRLDVTLTVVDAQTRQIELSAGGQRSAAWLSRCADDVDCLM